MTDPDWWPQVNKAFFEGDLATAEALLLAKLKDDPRLDSMPRGRVNAANILMAAGHWSLVDGLLPNGTNFFRTSGWLGSLQAGWPVDAQGGPLPWLTYPAMDFLEPRIDPAWSVLEWGCGTSTIWWSQRVAKVTSIENDPVWYDRVRAFLPPHCAIAWESTAERYVGAARGGSYDVIVIDGAWRNECAAAVADLPARLIVFDNTDTKANTPGTRTLMDAGWQRLDFFGLIPSFAYKNCTSLFYKDASVLRAARLPSEMRLSSGPTCSQALGS